MSRVIARIAGPRTCISRSDDENAKCSAPGSGAAQRLRCRFDAQLIHVPADRQIWGERYEGDFRDTLALQSRVARSIAQQIRATLNLREQVALEKSKVVNPEAYEAYLKGRYFLNKRTGDGLRTAVEYFSHAIETDPNYGEAYPTHRELSNGML
jgi:hypothetical protein